LIVEETSEDNLNPPLITEATCEKQPKIGAAEEDVWSGLLGRRVHEASKSEAWDHAIELVPSAQPKGCKVYPLLVTKQAECKGTFGGHSFGLNSDPASAISCASAGLPADFRRLPLSVASGRFLRFRN
jgi:hypothetical protein